MSRLIGRANELKMLKTANQSNKAELGIVYGRRRVGKSTLLKAVKSENSLFLEGVKGLTKEKQIRHFLNQIAEQTNTIPTLAKNWSEALQVLTQFISKGRWYVVLDEVPWMASGHQEFISYLKYYWDNKWKQNNKLHIVLCGSIASFMVKHVIHSEALHNRKTYEFKLGALSIKEASQFFPNTPRDQVLKYLITFGGVPKYLEQINPEISYDKNIEYLCLNKNSFFLNEFETIFKEQFKTYKTYEKITELLAKKSLNKEVLSRSLKMSSGGGLTSYLEHLESADFIKLFRSFDFQQNPKDKTRRYTIWDEWLKFYFTYIKKNQKIISINTNKKLFSAIIEPNLYNYMGFGFEKLIMKNIPDLMEIMDIELSQVVNYGPYFKSSKSQHSKGFQIDLLIEEQDHTLTVIECKNSIAPIGISIINEFEQKIKKLNPPKNNILKKVLVTAGDVTQELEKKRYFSQIVRFSDFLY